MGLAGASHKMQIWGQSGGVGHERAPRWVQAFILTMPADGRLSKAKILEAPIEIIKY
jgi:hypothetical protein